MLFHGSLPLYMPSPRWQVFCLVLLHSLISHGQLAIDGLVLAISWGDRVTRSCISHHWTGTTQSCDHGVLRVLKSSKREQGLMHRGCSSLCWHHSCSCPTSQSKPGDQDQSQCWGNCKGHGPQGSHTAYLSGFRLLFAIPLIHPLHRCYEHLLEAEPWAGHSGYRTSS